MRNRIKQINCRWKTAVSVLLVLLIPLISSGQSFTAEESEWLENHRDRPLKFIMPPKYYPISFVENGAPNGVALEYLKILEEKLGIKTRLVDVPWPTGLKMARNKEIDFIPCISFTPERSEFLTFTESSYLSLPIVLIGRKDMADIRRLSDISGFRVAVDKNLVAYSKLKTDYQHLKLEFVFRETTPNVIKAVHLGEADFSFASAAVAGYLISQNGWTNLKISAETDWPDTNLRMAVRDDWPILAGILEKTLESIPRESREAVFNKWVPVRYEYALQKSVITNVILPIVAVALIIILILATLFILMLFRRNQLITNEVQNKLESQQTLLDSVINSIPDFIFVKDRQGKYLVCNTAFAKFAGRDIKDIIGLSDLDLFEESMAQEFRSRDQKIMESNSAFREDGWVTYPDGTKVLLDTLKVPFIDQKGDNIGLIGISHDITDRNLIEDDLKRSQQQLKALFEALPVGVTMIGSDGAIREANIISENILGISADEHRMRTLQSQKWEVIRPDGSPMPVEEYPASRALSGEGSVRNVEMGINRPDGSLVWINTSASPINESAGGGVAVAFEDVTRRKSFEQELRKLSQAVEQSPVSIVITDLDGNIEYVNARFCEVTGYSMDEALGQNPRILKSDNATPETYQKLWDTIQNGKEWRGEFLNKKKNGNLYWESATISPIITGEGVVTSYLAIKEDITERKRVEEDIQARAREQEETQTAMLNMMEDLDEEKGKAEEATRAKSDFLANMSHEIRTPMNAIMGMTHLALQTELTSKQTDYLTKVHGSATSLLGIINDILDFSKIEAGKLDMEFIEFSLDEVMDNVTTLITGKSQEKELEFLFKIEPEVPRFLVGDPLRLGQILINLSNNAVKFTSKGEVVITVEPVNQNEKTITLQFTVRDTGIGLSEEQIGNLFQSFSQADTSTTRKFGGTGLGLTISKRLVEMMNGRIWVESEIGKGSRFIFTGDFQIQSIRQETTMALADELRGLKVLVVDDNETARLIFKEMLESFNFDVELAFTGGKAIDALTVSKKPYDLILMDWKMPGMNGIETSRQIKNNLNLPQTPKIVMCTSYGREEVMRQAQEVELDGFLMKPVNPSVLLDTILQVFGKATAGADQQKFDVSVGTVNLDKIRGAKILLVEDNEINQQVAQELLEKQGFFIEIADNGKLGLEKATKNDYDAVLMDIQMPVMGGYESAEKIRESRSRETLPIIAMTANAMVGDREKALAAGMNDHVAKPIDPANLYQALVQWIEPGDRTLPDSYTAPEPTEDGDEIDQSLTDLPGIDSSAGLARVGGNIKLYRNLLNKFALNQETFIEEIQKALAEKDFELAERLAHTLKGVAGNIGANDLQQASKDLEADIKQNRENVTSTLIEDTQVQLDRVLISIQDLEADSHNPSEVDTSTYDLVEAKRLLGDLKNLLEEDDTEAADIIEALKKTCGGAEIDQQINLIEKAIAQYDFDEALEEFSQLEKLIDSQAT